MKYGKHRYIGVLATSLAAAVLAACGGGGGSGGYGGGAPAADTTPPRPINAAPTISAVSGQSMDERGTLGPLSFTVGDAETEARSLTVAVTSSNPTLIPASGLELEGSGAERGLTIYAAEQGSGTADITIAVTDAGGARTTASFKLVVNDLPALEFSEWMRNLALTRGPDGEPVGLPAEEGGTVPQIEDMNRLEVTDATADDEEAYRDLLPPEEPTEGSV